MWEEGGRSVGGGGVGGSGGMGGGGGLSDIDLLDAKPLFPCGRFVAT